MTKYEYNFGVKTRIFPSSQQKKIITRNSDASRFIYNNLVALNKEKYMLKRTLDKIYIPHLADRLSSLEMQLKDYTAFVKFQHRWLRHKDIDSLAISFAIRSYKAAWNMYHKVHKAGVPQFRKKNYTERYQTSGQAKELGLHSGSVRLVDESHILVPKLGKVKISKLPKQLMAMKDKIHIATTTLRKNSDGSYFISLQLSSHEPFKSEFKKTGSIVGVDLNIDNFYTDSNNKVVANPRYYKNTLKRLKVHQRKLSKMATRAKSEKRPLRDSKNYQKERLLLAKLQQRISNKRNNFIHNLTIDLVKNHDFISCEELRSRNMLKNHALAMSISDVGWRTFLSQLEYKAKLYGKQFVTVDPKWTTQTCSDCGLILKGDDKLTLADREWTCKACGSFHIRDYNAAKNILNKGKTLINI